MDKKEIYDLMANNPVFHLATVQGDQPRVRGMLLYRADEKGIIFHTGAMKPLYEQVKSNPKAELCFWDMQHNVQVRVSGMLEFVDDNLFKDEIYNHPTIAFLSGWKESMTPEAFYSSFIVFRLRHGKVRVWTMETNFEASTEIDLD